MLNLLYHAIMLVSLPCGFPMTEVSESIGDLLRRARVGRFLTQEQLADAAGVGRATIARLEAGGSCPRMRTISALATALEVEASELVPDPESAWPRRLA